MLFPLNVGTYCSHIADTVGTDPIFFQAFVDGVVGELGEADTGIKTPIY